MEERLSVDYRGAQALKGEVPLPALMLKRADYEHNLRLMAEYCQDKGIGFAPHAKSHMSPDIAWDQVKAGAWGVSVATAWQAKVFADAGMERILIANQVVDRCSLQMLRDIPSRKRVKELHLFVDSAAGVECAERELAKGKGVGAIIEVGPVGGRAGLRRLDDAVTLARRIAQSTALRLVGVGGYEGAVPVEPTAPPCRALGMYFREVLAVRDELQAEGLFKDACEVILTLGGTGFFDLAAEVMSKEHQGEGRLSLLRSGCYAFVDHGIYEECLDRVYRDGSMKVGARVIPKRDGFRPALVLAAAVQSVPEPGLAIVAMGKRDAGCDIGPPIPLCAVRQGRIVPIASARTAKLVDQHAFLVNAPPDLAVGDLVLFGINHPCTNLDKHSVLYEVDETYTVLRTLKTHFRAFPS